MPSDHPDLDQALKLISQGKFSEVKICLEDLLRDYPENTDLLYNLGMTFIELGELVKAIEHLQKCIQLDPDYSNAYVALGLAYYRQGDLQNARDHFLQAIRANPNNLFALRNMGSLFRKEGDSVKSLYYLRRAFGLNPYDPRTLLGLALAYRDLRDIERAERCFRDLLDMNAPENLQAVARDGLRELAVGEPQPLGLAIDAVFYLLDAIRIFRGKTFMQMQEAVSEINALGRHVSDLNDPMARYTLRSIPGEFSPFQLVCILYAGLRQSMPGRNIGIDLSEEYDLALKLAESEDIL